MTLAQVETKTLFFIADAKATAADEARAAKIPGIVMFRNASEVSADDNPEAADQVTLAANVAMPSDYSGYTLVSPERPLGLTIVPDAPTFDLSDVEHGDLRAMARFMDGTVVDVTTSCAWESATPGTGTIGAATGIFTPVGVGTSVITATYPVAAPGEPGAAYASKALTVSANPLADAAVVVGLITYTFKAEPAATSSATAVQVLLGATKEESVANLRAAIMGGQYGKGVLFSSDAPVNTLARADILDDETPNVMTATAKLPGTAGNSIAISETLASGAWAGGATALSGGANATSGVADTTTVTVVA